MRWKLLTNWFIYFWKFSIWAIWLCWSTNFDYKNSLRTNQQFIINYHYCKDICSFIFWNNFFIFSVTAKSGNQNCCTNVVTLPNSTFFHWIHFAANVTIKIICKFWCIANNSIDSKFVWGVNWAIVSDLWPNIILSENTALRLSVWNPKQLLLIIFYAWD